MLILEIEVDGELNILPDRVDDLEEIEREEERWWRREGGKREGGGRGIFILVGSRKRVDRNLVTSTASVPSVTEGSPDYSPLVPSALGGSLLVRRRGGTESR